MRHTWNNAPCFEKCATLGEMRHIWKNAAHLAKYPKSGKMRNAWLNTPHSKNANSENCSDLKKFATFGKMDHT